MIYQYTSSNLYIWRHNLFIIAIWNQSKKDCIEEVLLQFVSPTASLYCLKVIVTLDATTQHYYNTTAIQHAASSFVFSFCRLLQTTSDLLFFFFFSWTLMSSISLNKNRCAHNANTCLIRQLLCVHSVEALALRQSHLCFLFFTVKVNKMFCYDSFGSFTHISVFPLTCLSVTTAQKPSLTYFSYATEALLNWVHFITQLLFFYTTAFRRRSIKSCIEHHEELCCHRKQRLYIFVFLSHWGQYTADQMWSYWWYWSYWSY